METEIGCFIQPEVGHADPRLACDLPFRGLLVTRDADRLSTLHPIEQPTEFAVLWRKLDELLPWNWRRSSAQIRRAA
jgi:hypothetical protein